jgi:hypothetical protein
VNHSNGFFVRIVCTLLFYMKQTFANGVAQQWLKLLSTDTKLCPITYSKATDDGFKGTPETKLHLDWTKQNHATAPVPHFSTTKSTF